MKKAALLVLAAVAGVLPLAFLAGDIGIAIPHAAARSQAAPQAPALLASPKASDVVDAADAFLATLSDAERAVAQIELTHCLAARWTNFPGGSNVRNGVFYRDSTRRVTQ